jgi:exonuclease V gamma subunit
MISKKSTDVFNTFGTYLEKGDEASKEKSDNFTQEELLFALVQNYEDRGNPTYNAVEKRIAELRKNKGKRKDRLYIFFSG